jgi:cation diffusion facilitator family transporter
MASETSSGATHTSVVITLVVACAEALGLGVAAWLSGSVALGAQTADSAADVAVEVFLLIGVVSSARVADDSHPLGYGRERFFWSLLAALGIFIGGGGLGLEEAVQSVLHPSAVHDYLIAYVVLGTTVALDTFALAVVLRPLLKHTAGRGRSLRRHIQRSTDPASTTLLLSGACEVLGGFVAAAGLALGQLSGSPAPDAVASGLIGLLLLLISVLLVRTNRELLTGRGLPPPMLAEIRQVIATQPGVLEVPDLFGVVVGPLSFIVDGDVIFDDEMDIPAVEATIVKAAAVLRQRWPSIEYLYLTPVGAARSRRAVRSGDAKEGGTVVAMAGGGPPEVRSVPGPTSAPSASPEK